MDLQICYVFFVYVKARPMFTTGEKNDWPIHEELVVGTEDILDRLFLNRDHVILPLLHIKLDLMKKLSRH